MKRVVFIILLFLTFSFAEEDPFFQGKRSLQVNDWDISIPATGQVDNVLHLEINSLPDNTIIKRMSVHSYDSSTSLWMCTGIIKQQFNLTIKRDGLDVPVVDINDGGSYYRRGTADTLTWKSGSVELSFDTPNVYVLTLETLKSDSILEYQVTILKIGDIESNYFFGLRELKFGEWDINIPAVGYVDSLLKLNINSIKSNEKIRRIYVHSYSSDGSFQIPEGYINQPFSLTIQRDGITVPVTEASDQHYYSRRGTADTLSWTSGEIEFIFDTSNIYQITLETERSNGVVEYQRALVRIDVGTSVSNDDNLVRYFNLNQNYPNPFNPLTTIKYNIQKHSFVILTIYDQLGRKVKTLVYDKVPAGEHSIVWNGKDFNENKVSSGIYFYKLTVDNRIPQTRRMLLLK